MTHRKKVEVEEEEEEEEGVTRIRQEIVKPKVIILTSPLKVQVSQLVAGDTVVIEAVAEAVLGVLPGKVRPVQVYQY